MMAMPGAISLALLEKLRYFLEVPFSCSCLICTFYFTFWFVVAAVNFRLFNFVNLVCVCFHSSLLPNCGIGLETCLCLLLFLFFSLVMSLLCYSVYFKYACLSLLRQGWTYIAIRFPFFQGRRVIVPHSVAYTFVSYGFC